MTDDALALSQVFVAADLATPACHSVAPANSGLDLFAIYQWRGSINAQFGRSGGRSRMFLGLLLLPLMCKALVSSQGGEYRRVCCIAVFLIYYEHRSPIERCVCTVRSAGPRVDVVSPVPQIPRTAVCGRAGVSAPYRSR